MYYRDFDFLAVCRCWRVETSTKYLSSVWTRPVSWSSLSSISSDCTPPLTGETEDPSQMRALVIILFLQVEVHEISHVSDRLRGHHAILHWTHHVRRQWSQRSLRHSESVQGLQDLQVLQTFPRFEDPRLHPPVLRLRTRILGLQPGHGHHHLRHHHVLLWEECGRLYVLLHSFSFLVHNCHNDNIRVSYTPR